MANSNILAGLVKSANLFVTNMKVKLNSGNYPKAISQAIKIETPKTSGGTSYIDIVIDLIKAPMARAFEWGSGEHATRGKKGKYPIDPTNASILIIPRERWPNFKPPPNIDPVSVMHVEHPGIAPKPYIEPALQETKDDIKKILAKDFKAQILLDMGKDEVIEVRL